MADKIDTEIKDMVDYIDTTVEEYIDMEEETVYTYKLYKDANVLPCVYKQGLRKIMDKYERLGYIKIRVKPDTDMYEVDIYIKSVLQYQSTKQCGMDTDTIYTNIEDWELVLYRE